MKPGKSQMAPMLLKACWEGDCWVGPGKAGLHAEAAAASEGEQTGLGCPKPQTSMRSFSVHCRQHLVRQELGLAVDVREAVSEGEESKSWAGDIVVRRELGHLS